MANSEISLNKPLTRIPKWSVWLLVLFSFGGFLDATYLTVKHYLGTPIPCSIFAGCEKVTTSQYATLWGIPVAMLGAIYYLLIFVLLIAYLDTKKEPVLYFTARLTLIGFLASIWFLYLQLFIIKAICLYCVVSAFTSTMLFVLGIMLLTLKRQAITNNSYSA
jgi:uncharacterized membrane protein